MVRFPFAPDGNPLIGRQELAEFLGGLLRPGGFSQAAAWGWLPVEMDG